MSMEHLSQWLIGVCMACAAAGLLERLCDTGPKKSVIKLVLTLYILVSVFPTEWSMPSWELSYDEAAQIEQTTAQYNPYDSAAEQAGAQLSRQYSQQYGVPIEVTIRAHAQGAFVESVSVAADETFEQIQEELRKELGEDVSITQMQGGTQNETNTAADVG